MVLGRKQPKARPKRAKSPRGPVQQQGALGTQAGHFCNLGGCCGRLGVVESMFLACNQCGQLIERAD
jgi:hypothetical protein